MAVKVAPRGTPGYTGRYEVRNGILYAMQPDGQWVPLRAFSGFKSKGWVGDEEVIKLPLPGAAS